MTIGQFFAILWARKWVALLVFLAIVSTTLGISLSMAKQYTATASVVVDVKPDPLSTVALSSGMLPGFMATQVDIMSSARVAQRVIQDLKLLERPEIRRQWEESDKTKASIEQFLVDSLSRNLKVKPGRESNVITIAYMSGDPAFSAAMANAFARAYIATTLELRTGPASNFRTLFDQQLGEARSALEKAQSRLSAFQQQAGIIATDERFDIENSRLNELSSQLTQLQAIATESSSRQAKAQSGQADRMQEVLNNQLISVLKADIARNEARLQELSSRLGDNHPQVVEAKANLTELRARIDAETRKVTGSVSISSAINREREAVLQRELATQRAKVLKMRSVRDEGVVLQREVESAQRIYDSLAVRLNQTALESQSNQSFAHLLNVAQPPLEPSSPNVVLNMAMAAFLGVLVALGIVLAWELMDRRIRTTADVVYAVGLPVLGTLPKPGAKRYAAGYRLLPGAHSPGSPLGLPGSSQGGTAHL